MTGPRLEITPSPGQYQQLVADLAKLREAGAKSNTAAICAAVHSAAEEAYAQDQLKRTPGGANTPPARQQEVES